MENQAVFRIIFCFIVQSALLSLRYWYHESLEVHWVGLLLHPIAQSSSSLNSEEAPATWLSYLPSKDLLGNWTLLLFPLFIYSLLTAVLSKFRSKEISNLIISETSFQITLLALLHPIQLQGFLISPIIHLIVIFVGILFFLFKISNYFNDFNLIKFSIFTSILTLISALAAQQFLLKNPTGYTLGMVTLFNILLLGKFCQFHLNYQIWCSVVLLGAGSVGLLNLLTSSWEDIFNISLSTVYYSNSKVIDFIFPFLR